MSPLVPEGGGGGAYRRPHPREECHWRRGRGGPYNALMDRLLDKTIVMLCCLALLAQAPIDAAQVAWLLAAVAGAFLGEVLPRRGRMAASLALLCCAPAHPGARPFIPLAAYDALRPDGRDVRDPALLAGGVLASVSCLRAAQGGGVETALLTCLFSLMAAFLSVRTTQAARSAERNRRTRDALQERALSLESKNRDLIDRQGYEVELATLAERARIAREIHDNVGHILTRATLQVEALRVVHAAEPGVAADFADVGTTLAEALDTVRASVHALRDDSCDLSVQVRNIAERCGDDLDIDLDVTAGRVPAAVSTALLAILREAISNAERHGHARHLRIRCTEQPGFWNLTVDDDGTGDAGRGGKTAVDAAATGMGLSSMRERVEALGGTFHAGPRTADAPGAARGWRVFASIPRPQDGTAATARTDSPTSKGARP